jgi:hypothetical protein
MNKDRYIYVVIAKGDTVEPKTKWIKCAFNTRVHAGKWIKRMQEKDIALSGISRTDYKIKQILLHSFGDPRLKKNHASN